MPVVITATQLRTVLGVSTGLFNDTVLNGIIDTAEEAVGALLVKDEISVNEVERDGVTVTLHLTENYEFFIGENIIVQDVRLANFDGAHVITAIPDKRKIQYASNTSGTVVKQRLIPKARVTRQGRGLDFYTDIPAIQSAMLEVAVDVFNSRVAPGGVQQALDFTPGPYRMGKSLIQRVAALIVRYRDVETVCG